MLKHPDTVTFDPTDVDHQVALAMLTMHNRQHPTLRFTLQDPSSNIPHELTRAFIDHHLSDRAKARLGKVMDSQSD